MFCRPSPPPRGRASLFIVFLSCLSIKPSSLRPLPSVSSASLCGMRLARWWSAADAVGGVSSSFTRGPRFSPRRRPRCRRPVSSCPSPADPSAPPPPPPPPPLSPRVSSWSRDLRRAVAGGGQTARHHHRRRPLPSPRR